MSDTSRIPHSIVDFHGFLTTTCAYLVLGTPNNATLLGWTAAELTTWTGYLTAWQPYYIKYLDKRNARTPAVTEILNGFIDKACAYNKSHKLLDRIAASTSATTTDLNIFRIKTSGVTKKATRTVSTTPVEISVSPAFVLVGGGVIKVKCKNNTDKGQHIVEGSDSVQYVYKIDDKAPEGADDSGLSSGLSTKASFSLSLGSSNSGKPLYIFFRWYNTKHPELAGPWTPLQTLSIP